MTNLSLDNIQLRTSPQSITRSIIKVDAEVMLCYEIFSSDYHQSATHFLYQTMLELRFLLHSGNPADPSIRSYHNKYQWHKLHPVGSLHWYCNLEEGHKKCLGRRTPLHCLSGNRSSSVHTGSGWHRLSRCIWRLNRRRFGRCQIRIHCHKLHSSSGR